MEGTVSVLLISGLVLLKIIVFAVIGILVLLPIIWIMIYVLGRYLLVSRREEMYEQFFFYFGDPAKFGWRDVFLWEKNAAIGGALYLAYLLSRKIVLRDKAEQYFCRATPFK